MGIIHEFPQFPADISCHPLLVVDYALIQASDTDELEKLWKAATGLGFWYLNNHGMDELVDEMFNLGAETMALTLEEKMKYNQGSTGRSAGYRAVDATAVDSSGTKGNAEFMNIAKDDALSYPIPTVTTYPEPVNRNMESIAKPFIFNSLKIIKTLMGVLEYKLGLPEGTFAARHRVEDRSGCEARITHSPPLTGEDAVIRTKFLGAHTDYGSLSVLHNRLGGLQVLVPGTQDWQYVKPLKGHAICNLGDAMAIFSGGILRANLHRVVVPPGYQSSLDRWSLVFFSRPANTVLLNALTEDSTLIRDAVRRSMTKNGEDRFNTGSTAGEWFARRVKMTRLENRTGEGSWRAGRGMEHLPDAQ